MPSCARRIWSLPLCLLLSTVAVPLHPARGEASPDEFQIETLAETRISQLPPGQLFWRVENFPSLADAKAASHATALAAEAAGRAWLLTLGPQGGRTPGGQLVAEIGPVKKIPAPQYLLKINRGGGVKGAQTPVHFHPGSEAFHVIAGRLCQKTRHGNVEVEAGQSMNGHEPGMAMQLTSCGRGNLDQLVMFVVDATKPFSSPASFD